ncbi:MAG: putative bifunctional diguanylate cyclase/phosphodiesterase [Actinomycetes bacterium]
MAATLLPVVALGFVLISGYGSEARARGLEQARSETAVIASSVIEPQLSGHPLTRSLNARDEATLHAIANSLIVNKKVLRLRLHDMTGHTVFSNDDSGFSDRLDDEVLDALHGKTLALLTHANSDAEDTGPLGPRAVEVYMPLNQTSTRTLGVLEVYVPYAPIAHDVAAGTRRLSWEVGVGLTLLYLVLGAISVSITRRLRREARENRFLARHDALTRLPNRILFRERAAELVAAAQRHGGRCAVAVIDLDRFKEVNDTLGHHTGDELLLELSGRLSACGIEGVVIARLGGDEFGVVLPAVADQLDATRRLFEVRLLLEEDVVLRDLPLSIQASVGYALSPDDGTEVDDLLQYADVAMYHAKSRHLGVARYDSVYDTYDAAQLALVAELRQAIEKGQLVLHFQPKVTTSTGDVPAVEALVRWNHPVKGLVPPDAFLPVAEQTDLIDPLTSWVLDEALRQLRDWDKQTPGLAVAVNVSARNLTRPDFADEVLAALNESRVTPDRLLLEITETALVADPERAAQTLAKLQRQGVRVSLDDFGRGQTSLGYLSHLALYELKIDKSFVLGRDDPTNAAIISSVIQLGHNLGLQVVAEGVETNETFEWLRSNGCDIAQGYLFARPMPADDMQDWLREHHNAVAASSPI